MTKATFINISLGLIVGLVLALHTTNVEGAPDLPQCKTVYATLFDAFEGIITGGASAATSVRSTYNTCAEQADSYTALVACAVTAYAGYGPKLEDVKAAKAQDIMNAYNTFRPAIRQLTDNAGVRLNERGVPIPDFMTLINEVSSWQARAPSRARGA